MDIVDPRIEDYMRSLLGRYDEPVLLEMEAEDVIIEEPEDTILEAEPKGE